MKIATAIIPARLASTRMNDKPLAELEGQPLIWWVWEAARNAHLIEDIVVACDSKRVKKTVESFGGRAVITPSDIVSGTDRVAEVARNIETQWIVNVQCDEPLIQPQMLDALVAEMIKQGTEGTQMGTLAVHVNDSSVMSNPGTAKIVVDQSGKALYFSRQMIPYFLNSQDANIRYLKHIGVYMYKKEFLLKFPQLKKGPLEIAENLEQLRALENGYRIQVVLVDEDTIHVDTVDDLIRAEKCVRSRKNR